jgi:hypothetical protein
MKRQLAVVAAVVTAGAVAAAGVQSASAAPAPAPVAPVASVAASQAPIRTLVDTWSFQLNGYGNSAGWYYRSWYTAAAVRSPALAISETFHEAYFVKGKPKSDGSSEILAGGTWYEKENGASKWTAKKATASNLAQNEAEVNPYDTLAKVLAIPGAALVGPGHYRVTCTPSQANAYLNWDFGQQAVDLTQNGIKTISINFWVDSLGRPVKDTVTGQSSDVRVSAVETFTKYNESLKIKAP